MDGRRGKRGEESDSMEKIGRVNYLLARVLQGDDGAC